MKAILSTIITLLVFVSSPQELNAQKINPDDIIGEWNSDDNGAVFQIYKKDGKYYGKILWFIDEQDENGNLVKDKKNSDKTLRNRTFKGIEFINGFSYDDGTYKDGTIYNSEDGIIMNVSSCGSSLPLPYESVYGATKAYVTNFSETIAEELVGTGVTVTVLSPGVTRTEFIKRAQMPEDLKAFNPTWAFYLEKC